MPGLVEMHFRPLYTSGVRVFFLPVFCEREPRGKSGSSLTSCILLLYYYFNTICLFLGISIAFSPWFIMYATLRALLGFISVSVVFSGFCLAIELVGGKWRTVAGISYLYPVSISYMTIAGIAYLVRDWRSLQLAISLPGILFLGLW